MGGQYNCLMENQAEATHRQISRPAPGCGVPPRGRFPPAAAQPPPPPAARAQADSAAPRALPARPRSCAPTLGLRPARRSTCRQGGRRLGAVGPASLRCLPGRTSAPGEIRGHRGVWLSTSTLIFFPLTLGFSSLKWARLKSGVRDLN